MYIFAQTVTYASYIHSTKFKEVFNQCMKLLKIPVLMKSFTSLYIYISYYFPLPILFCQQGMITKYNSVVPILKA